MFFWTVDVIPSKGEDAGEAREIVRRGPILWLAKKMMCHIDEWTYEDTNAFVSLINWRARLFFKQREKTLNHIAALQGLYEDTGKQPYEFDQRELAKMLKPYAPSWFQKAIVTPQFFNSIMGATIIIVAILYLSPSH
jgi:hypothetical protein